MSQLDDHACDGRAEFFAPVKQRWMKHREKQGVWHLAAKPGYSTGKDTSAWVTQCRGDMLFGSIGPIVQQFEGLPKSPKCVRCTQIFLDSNENVAMRNIVDAMKYKE